MLPCFFQLPAGPSLIQKGFISNIVQRMLARHPCRQLGLRNSPRGRMDPDSQVRHTQHT